MLEIIFSESVQGSLRFAKGFAKGEGYAFPLKWSIGDISDSAPEDCPSHSRRILRKR